MSEDQAEDQALPEQISGSEAQETSSKEDAEVVGNRAQSADDSLSPDEAGAKDSDDGDPFDAETLSEDESAALRSGIDKAFQELADASPKDDDEPSQQDPPVSAEEINPTEPALEPDSINLSDSEISQLVAQAAESATPADAEPAGTVEPEQEEELEQLSEDELADLVRKMIAQQGDEIYGGPPDEAISEEPAPFAEAQTGEPEVSVESPEPAAMEASADTAAEEEGTVMSDDDIAALIAQTEALNSTPAAAPAEAPAEPAAVEATEEQPEGILSASQLASLLGSSDPAGDLVPSQSSSLDDDELAKLVADAADLEAGLNTQPVVAGESLPELEQVANAEPAQAPAESAPTPAQHAASAHTGSDIGAIKAVPSHLAIRALALPIRFQDGKILCKVAQPTDQAAVDRLSRETGLGVIVEPAPILEVVRGLQACYSEVQSDSAHMALLSITPKKNDIFSVFRRSA